MVAEDRDNPVYRPDGRGISVVRTKIDRLRPDEAFVHGSQVDPIAVVLVVREEG